MPICFTFFSPYRNGTRAISCSIVSSTGTRVGTNLKNHDVASRTVVSPYRIRRIRGSRCRIMLIYVSFPWNNPLYEILFQVLTGNKTTSLLSYKSRASSRANHGTWRGSLCTCDKVPPLHALEKPDMCPARVPLPYPLGYGCSRPLVLDYLRQFYSENI